MCLAIPGQIKKILKDNQALVDFMGIQKTVATELIENPKIGDYVIVHAGFAINKLDTGEALETLKHFRELH